MRKRLAAMQDWPLLTHAGGDGGLRRRRSSEAEGMTMKGSLPPEFEDGFS